MIVVGAAAGAGAIAFYACLGLAQLALWGDPQGGWIGAIATNGVPPLIDVAGRAAWWRRLLLPAAGGLVVGAIGWLLRGEGGSHGMTELLEVVGFGRRPTRARNAARRVLSAIVTMGSGGSAGQEGPIVQLGGSLAAGVGRLFRLTETERRTLVACGIGAGVAAAFNTPLGGALFAIEVAIGSTSFDIVWPVVLAAVAAQAVSRLYLGPGPLYGMSLSGFHATSAGAIPLCALLGAMGGALGGVYAGGIEWCSERIARLAAPRWLSPALGGLACGAIGVWFSQVHGNGYPFILGLTTGHETAAGLLVALLLAKLAATWLTLGSGGGGGIFTPSLFVGAALGAAFGAGVRAVAPGFGMTPAELAVVGMAAVFAGTFHAPLTAIVVHLETTRDFDASLPLIVACLAAQATTRLVARESIYHHELARRGTSWSFAPRERALRSGVVGDVMRAGARAAVAPGTSFDDVARLFAEGRDARLYVAGERLLGAIDLHDVKSSLGEQGQGLPVVAGDLAIAVEPLLADETLEVALRRIDADPTGELPVCERGTMKFLGVVTRAEIEARVREAR